MWEKNGVTSDVEILLIVHLIGKYTYKGSNRLNKLTCKKNIKPHKSQKLWKTTL